MLKKYTVTNFKTIYYYFFFFAASLLQQVVPFMAHIRPLDYLQFRFKYQIFKLH